jgi:hypothetical protein
MKFKIINFLRPKAIVLALIDVLSSLATRQRLEVLGLYCEGSWKGRSVSPVLAEAAQRRASAVPAFAWYILQNTNVLVLYVLKIVTIQILNVPMPSLWPQLLLCSHFTFSPLHTASTFLCMLVKSYFYSAPNISPN